MSKDPYAKIDETNRRYFSSEKGKSAIKKYANSDKGRETRDNYLKSEKGKAALLRYHLSEKGFATRERRKELNRLLTQCNKFLEENPTLTIDDFFSQLGNLDGNT